MSQNTSGTEFYRNPSIFEVFDIEIHDFGSVILNLELAMKFERNNRVENICINKSAFKVYGY